MGRLRRHWKTHASRESGHGSARVVYGDFAYTTCVFHTAPVVGDFKLSCTNVLRRVDGVWKIIHHHPDKVPAVAEAIQRIAESD